MIDGVQVLTSTIINASAITDDSSFAALETDWDELLEHSDQRVFFLRFSWNSIWWRTLRPPDSQLFIVTCRDEHGRLVGLAPFYLRQRRTAGIPHVRELMFLGTGVYAQTSEYLDIVARRGYEPAVAEAIVECLRRNRDWDRLLLREIPDSSTMLTHLVAALDEKPEIEICNRSYFVDTSVDWETFKKGASQSARRNVLPRTRKFFDLHECKLTKVETEDELEIAYQALVRLHQARWRSKGEPGSFALPGFGELLRESMSVSLGENRLALWTFEVDGAIAAVRLDFIDNNIAHAFQAGFDPAYASLSLGQVMNGLCIRAYIEDDRICEYDLMGGSATYKESWTKLYKDSVCFTLTRPGVRSTTYKSIELAKSMGKTALRTTVPKPLRVAGHRLISRRHYR